MNIMQSVSPLLGDLVAQASRPYQPHPLNVFVASTRFVSREMSLTMFSESDYTLFNFAHQSRNDRKER